jgi:flavin reductase (DIM6/NTAB) family NADH-FMN oxidoreductase RutF
MEKIPNDKVISEIVCPTTLVGVMWEKHNLTTVCWITQVSENPLQIAISLCNKHYSLHVLKETKEFAVNFLREGQDEIAKFCGMNSGWNVDKMKQLGLATFAAKKISVPLLTEAIANLECRAVNFCPAGDYTIVVGEVIKQHYREGKPLLEYKDGWGTFSPSTPR